MTPIKLIKLRYNCDSYYIKDIYNPITPRMEL
jgi:hypothetical protein